MNRIILALGLCLFFTSKIFADGTTNSPVVLTLADAQQLALKNHPQIAAADYRSLAAQEALKETRAGFFPTVNLYGNGFNRYWVNGLKLLPYCTDNGGNFEPTKEGAKILHVIVDKLEDLKLKRKQSILEIENTLIALGSYKKIQVEMPETFKYLPSNGVSTALMLNVAPINEKINCLISGDEKCLGKI